METVTTPLPFFFISQDTVDKRAAGFTSDKLGILSNALGKPDTKSIWYSREHIAGLLEEIDLVNGDGLRVFFGRYEAGHPYEGQLCLVMSSTRANNTGGHDNVILEKEPDFEDRSALSRAIEYNPDDESTIPKGYNYGSPCPPLCD